jgi:hypothetical protein
MTDPEMRTRVARRGAGFQRLRRLTGAAAAATVALSGVFTAVAARSFAGHTSAPKVVPPPHAPVNAAKTTPTKVPAPPALPSESSSAQAVTPLAPSPAPAPAPVQQQPAVVSGGS